MSNTFLLKLSILGTVLMLYGGLNHLRKNPAAQAAILKRLPPKYHVHFNDLVSPKSAMRMEEAKADLKKIRGVDENCMQDGGNCNRYAEKAQLQEKFGAAAKGDNPLGKAAQQLINVEKAKFDQFKKIDSITE